MFNPNLVSLSESARRVANRSNSQAPSSVGYEDDIERKPGPPLPPDYKFTDKDVCSGRGKKHWNLPGNVSYRNYIQDHVGMYIAAKNKRDKTVFISKLVRVLRQNGYQFIKETASGQLHDMGDKEAREKVAHCLRDQVTAIKSKLKNQSSHMGQEAPNSHSVAAFAQARNDHQEGQHIMAEHNMSAGVRNHSHQVDPDDGKIYIDYWIQLY